MELDPLGLTAATIRTDRLRLDPLRVADAEALAEVLGDERLHEFTGGKPTTHGELRTHYARLLDGSGRPDEIWLNWVVRRRADGGAIGTVQATVRLSDGRRQASVAWVIGTEWQCQGFGSEAARALVGWLIAAGADEIVAYVVGSMQDTFLRAAWWIPVATAIIGSATGVILYGVFGTMVGEDLLEPSLLRVALVVSLLNALAVPVVLRAVRWATDTQASVRARAILR